jgi:hypothetical protein
MGYLFRYKPPPPFEAVAAALPVCCQLMQHFDTAVQDTACWAVSYIGDGPDKQRAIACQNAGLIQIVVELLRTQRPSVTLPAIRVIGNHVWVSAAAAQAILDMGVLPLMAPLMEQHVDPVIRKECCWMLSNVAAGTHVQVQAVLDSGLMPFVWRCLSDPDLKMKEEALFVVANIGGTGTPDQRRAVFEHPSCIPSVFAALRTGDLKICSIALHVCVGVLALGDLFCTADPTEIDSTQPDAATTNPTETDFAGTRGMNLYVARFEEHGVVNILHDLADSQDDEMSRLALRLMCEYFGGGGENQPVSF